MACQTDWLGELGGLGWLAATHQTGWMRLMDRSEEPAWAAFDWRSGGAGRGRWASWQTVSLFVQIKKLPQLNRSLAVCFIDRIGVPR